MSSRAVADKSTKIGGGGGNEADDKVDDNWHAIQGDGFNSVGVSPLLFPAVEAPYRGGSSLLDCSKSAAVVVMIPGLSLELFLLVEDMKMSSAARSCAMPHFESLVLFAS